MKVFQKASICLGAGALALLAAYAEAGAAEQPAATAQVQPQQRVATQAPAQRRTYRSYSYSPSRNFDGGARAPTWSRADSKTKFRYGYYPY